MPFRRCVNGECGPAYVGGGLQAGDAGGGTFTADARTDANRAFAVLTSQHCAAFSLLA